jgi:hypothetical protein
MHGKGHFIGNPGGKAAANSMTYVLSVQSAERQAGKRKKVTSLVRVLLL